MINHIVTELMDKFSLWDSAYFELWTLLFEAFALFLLLIVSLIPLLLFYYIVKLAGDF